MCRIRFSNFFRSVTLDLSEEAVALIRDGHHPNTVLSENDASAVIGKLARHSRDWGMIFAFNDGDGSLLWVNPDKPARYLTSTHRINA